jgi:hypothetical protein
MFIVDLNKKSYKLTLLNVCAKIVRGIPSFAQYFDLGRTNLLGSKQKVWGRGKKSYKKPDRAGPMTLQFNRAMIFSSTIIL